MSLAKRLSSIEPNRPNDGCRTCSWLESLSATDRQAFEDWIEGGHSMAQLYDLCASDPDNPLMVSRTAFRHHMKHDRLT